VLICVKAISVWLKFVKQKIGGCKERNGPVRGNFAAGETAGKASIQNNMNPSQKSDFDN
jgi:hypothetical protein